MKNFIIAVFAFSAIAGAAHAEGGSNHDYFSQLFQRYEHAFLLKTSDVGWYSGRCYSSEDRSTPIASLLVIREVNFDGHGPLFEDTKGIKFFTYDGNSEHSAYFDDEIENFETDVNDYVAANNRRMAEAKTSTPAWDTTTLDGVALTLRKDRDYLLVKASSKATNSYCYYFKKLK